MSKKFIYQFDAMSTLCELTLFAAEKHKADKAAEAVVLETKRLEKKYNYYDPASLLSEINDRKTDRLDSETKSLLQRAKQYYSATNGIFDITVATIKALYRDEKDPEILQKKKEVLNTYVGCEHFSIKRDRIIFDNPHTQLDLGGFVKEYAVDRAVLLLKKSKISSALVNFGGDIYALGTKPDGQKFTVGIKDPKEPSRYAQQIELKDQALTTSASYERNYTIGSETFSHILSTTKETSLSRSVSVISSSCVESGVYSTALMIDASLPTKNRVLIL